MQRGTASGAPREGSRQPRGSVHGPLIPKAPLRVSPYSTPRPESGTLVGGGSLGIPGLCP